jgi:hypothetical protein
LLADLRAVVVAVLILAWAVLLALVDLILAWAVVVFLLGWERLLVAVLRVATH